MGSGGVREVVCIGLPVGAAVCVDLQLLLSGLPRLHPVVGMAPTSGWAVGQMLGSSLTWRRCRASLSHYSTRALLLVRPYNAAYFTPTSTGTVPLLQPARLKLEVG